MTTKLRREVESLLEQEGTLLEHPFWRSSDLKPGSRLGPYEIVAKLGEGGMGVVYDRPLLILSNHSMNSEWVKTEIANARQREIREKRQILFPISLAPFEKIRGFAVRAGLVEA